MRIYSILDIKINTYGIDPINILFCGVRRSGELSGNLKLSVLGTIIPEQESSLLA